MKTRVFSGIQPSGNLHIGNYLGALKQWTHMQNSSKVRQQAEVVSSQDYELLFCIVDLHAITVPQDPAQLRANVRQLAALYVASGIDPKTSNIFVQSENPDHSYLTWIFDCITPMGWMERMTQYKDKASKQGERTSVGLFNYPILMACDFMLYDANLVPVGDDQKQHLELAADIGEKFNKKYGETFTIAKIFNHPHTARVMSLQNPLSKMSKSEVDPAGTIGMLDTPEEISKKIKRAVTDSGTEVAARMDKPALTNLLGIYSGFSGMSIADIEAKYKGVSYGVFKEDLAGVVVDALKPIQQKYAEILTDEKYIDSVLDEGLAYAHGLSSKKVTAVKELIGLSRQTAVK